MVCEKPTVGTENRVTLQFISQIETLDSERSVINKHIRTTGINQDRLWQTRHVVFLVTST